MANTNGPEAGALERRRGERRVGDRRAWPPRAPDGPGGRLRGRGVPRILARGLRRIAEAPLIPGNAAEILVDAPVAYPAMLALIAAARRSIGFENYIIRDDEVGQAFADALIERARAGVSVRVLYDWLGSFRTSRSLWRRLAEAGCEVRAFGAPAFLKPLRLFTRDHRKLLVVDGRAAIVGGFCIGREWLDDGGLGAWRDTAVRVEGPIGQALEAAFARMWRQAGGEMAHIAPAAPTPVDGVAIRVVDGPPAHGRAYRLYQLLSAVAERTVYVTGAYPLAPAPLRRALASAARAGVDVRLLVPSRSDLRLLNQAARAHYASLLRAGVRIYLWGGPMLHAKTLVVDGMIALVGSSNLNPWSLMGCYELDLQLEDRGVASRLEEQFRRDIQRARELTLAAWRRRPAGEQWKERLGAGLLWLPYKLYGG